MPLLPTVIWPHAHELVPVTVTVPAELPAAPMVMLPPPLTVVPS